MRRRTFRRCGVIALVALASVAGASTATAGKSRLPLPSGHSMIPYQVSCAPTSACFALGEVQGGQFVRDTGTHATRLMAPQLGKTGTINALACASATDCVAVGVANQPRVNHGLLALRWDGGRWSSTQLPAGPGRTMTQDHYQLNGLSCPTAGMCVAVGEVQGITKDRPTARALLFVRHGQHWSAARSPVTGGALRSVSCASASSCTAVGAETSGAVVLRLRGGHWTRVHLSAGASRAVGTSLTSISCPSTSSCVATGQINTTPHAAVPVTRVVVLRESGTGWNTEVPPPPALIHGHAKQLTDNLLAISCGAPGSCLGVGDSVNDGGDGAEAGVSIAVTPSHPHPVARTLGAIPVSVSCSADDGCLVGGGGAVRRITP